ncbi:MAG: DNA adenine methylase [Candidatus Nanohaloarchaea archaeon]
MEKHNLFDIVCRKFIVMDQGASQAETIQINDQKTLEESQNVYYNNPFPSTRYQGSKNKIKDWIWSILGDKEFESFLEPFAGTSAIGFEAKKRGKKVIVNDFLDFNKEVGKAIIENSGEVLTEDDLDHILTDHSHIDYPSLIQDEFEGKYFTDEENEWLDRVVTNIRNLDNKYKRAIAFSALGQACLMKRPFNLFHRANLDLRTRDVERNFGNKVTWEKPFEETFLNFVKEYNEAVFNNEQQNKAYGKNVFELDETADLVYLDPPYYSKKSGGTDYQYYYHFLDGMINYENWQEQINRSVKTKRLKHEKSIWNQEDRLYEAFDKLISKYKESTIALSYNTQGKPSVEALAQIMGMYKDKVTVKSKDHQYALNRSNGEIEEVLVIGEDK